MNEVPTTPPGFTPPHSECGCRSCLLAEIAFLRVELAKDRGLLWADPPTAQLKDVGSTLRKAEEALFPAAPTLGMVGKVEVMLVNRGEPSRIARCVCELLAEAITGDTPTAERLPLRKVYRCACKVLDA